MDKTTDGSIFSKIRSQYTVPPSNSYVAFSGFALLIFGWMATGVLSGSLAQFDLESRTLVLQLTAPTTTVVMRVTSTIGTASFLMPLFVVVAIVLVLSECRKDAARFALTMAGATLIELTLKQSFHRLRPATSFTTATYSAYSFPSGHALAAFCFYGQLALMLAARTNSKATRIAIWSLAGGLIFMIGLSRIYLSAHYTSDVIAGYAAAAAWSSALAATRPMQRRRINS